MNGHAVKSCNVLAAQAQGAEITTIEGLAASDGTMHPMQAAFKDCHGLQCGFCTSGILMSAAALLQRQPRPGRLEIVQAIDGHLCRCGAHNRVVRAIEKAAERLAAS